MTAIKIMKNFFESHLIFTSQHCHIKASLIDCMTALLWFGFHSKQVASYAHWLTAIWERWDGRKSATEKQQQSINWSLLPGENSKDIMQLFSSLFFCRKNSILCVA